MTASRETPFRIANGYALSIGSKAHESSHLTTIWSIMIKTKDMHMINWEKCFWDICVSPRIKGHSLKFCNNSRVERQLL